MKKTTLRTKFVASFMVMCMIICSALPVFAFESHGRIVYNDASSGDQIIVNSDEIIEALQALAPSSSSAYTPGTSYGENVYVMYNGHLYKSLVDSNTTTPGSDPTKWEIIPTLEQQWEAMKTIDANINSIATDVTSIKATVEDTNTKVTAIDLSTMSTQISNLSSALVGDTSSGTVADLKTMIEKLYASACNPISSSEGVTIGDTKCQLGSEIAVAVKRDDESDYDSTKKFKICWIQVDENGAATRIGLLGSGSSGDNWGTAMVGSSAAAHTWDWRVQINGTTYSNTSTKYSGDCADLLDPSRTDLTANYKATIPSLAFLTNYCAGYGRSYSYWTSDLSKSFYHYTIADTTQGSTGNCQTYIAVLGEDQNYGHVAGNVTGVDVYPYTSNSYFLRDVQSARAVPCIVVNL